MHYVHEITVIFWIVKKTSFYIYIKVVQIYIIMWTKFMYGFIKEVWNSSFWTVSFCMTLRKACHLFLSSWAIPSLISHLRQYRCSVLCGVCGHITVVQFCKEESYVINNANLNVLECQRIIGSPLCVLPLH